LGQGGCQLGWEVSSSVPLSNGLDHGGSYWGIEKENCLQGWLWHGEYHTMLGDMLIANRGWGLENQSLVFFEGRGNYSPYVEGQVRLASGQVGHHGGEGASDFFYRVSM